MLLFSSHVSCPAISASLEQKACGRGRGGAAAGESGRCVSRVRAARPAAASAASSAAASAASASSAARAPLGTCGGARASGEALARPFVPCSLLPFPSVQLGGQCGAQPGGSVFFA